MERNTAQDSEAQDAPKVHADQRSTVTQTFYSESLDRLDLAQKLHQKPIIAEVTKVSTGEQLERPIVVELDPTSACDLACPECISRDLLNRGGFSKVEMVHLGQQIIELGVRAVILIGGGEPLSHPATPALIRMLAQAGVAVGVTTNGTLIHKCLNVLAEFASWTRVSVDAGSSDTYLKFRPGRTGNNMFAKVIQNMRSLAEVKRGSLGFSYLIITRPDSNDYVNEHNIAEIMTAGILAKEIGCDYFEVKPAYDANHYLIGLTDQKRELLREQLSGLGKIVDHKFKVIVPRTLKTILEAETLVEEKLYHRCGISELRTLVTPTGVYVCPYHRGNMSKNFGNPKHASLRSIWAGSLRSRVMAETDPSHDCRFHCIRHTSNEELVRISAGGLDASHGDDGHFDPFI